jgi:DNA processing protein
LRELNERISIATNKVLALSMLSGIGPATVRKIAATPDFERTTLEQWATQVPALERALNASDTWSKALEKAEEQVDWAERLGARILSPLDSEYPPLLAATGDDPFLIFVRGQLAPDPTKSVAIIGTREPTEHGKTIAERIAEYFAERGWSIVSGLALGCDAIAHRTALEAKAHTVAVLAHGLQTIAPKQHEALAENILAGGGALLSEFPFGRAPIPQQFVKRDRIQAGLAQGVVMIQSDLRGGSLHASRAAVLYSRWLAVPYPTDKDRKAAAPKIQANLVLADGRSGEKAELLQCRPAALNRLIILRGREDYARMTVGANPSQPRATPAQHALL